MFTYVDGVYSFTDVGHFVDHLDEVLSLVAQFVSKTGGDSSGLAASVCNCCVGDSMQRFSIMHRVA